MITKERLVELIKQGATVWSSGWNEEVDLSRVCSVFYDNFGRYIIQVYEDEEHKPYYCADNLEEDVETAKFKYRYQNITRTETLSLPTWEEIKDRKEYSLSFCAKQSRYSLYIDMPYRKDEGAIVIVRHSDPASSLVFERTPATKAKYLEACELCRKLFLGEEEE